MGCTREDAVPWVMMQPALNKWSSGTAEARRYILFLCKQNSKTMVLWTVLLLLFSFSDRYEVSQPSKVALVKNPPANAGGIRDAGSIPGSGRFTGGRHGNPIQYSCLENPHGQWSLVGCSQWGRKESDRTERLNTFCGLHRIFKLFQIHRRCCTNIKHKLINNNYIL